MLKVEVTYNTYLEVDKYLWEPNSMEEVLHLIQRYLEDKEVVDFKIVKM